jgi:hypothetical protein
MTERKKQIASMEASLRELDGTIAKRTAELHEQHWESPLFKIGEAMDDPEIIELGDRRNTIRERLDKLKKPISP